MTRLNNKDKKKHKITDIVITTVGVLLLLFTTILVATKFITPGNFLFGKRFDIVLTDSMATVYDGQKDQYEKKGWTNQIAVHDLVVVKELTDNIEIKIGDIVTYNNPVYGLTTHRVVGIVADTDGRLKYVIQADATNVVDGEFYRSYIIGVVTNNAGQIGQVIFFLQSIYGTVMLVGLAMICFLYSFFSDYQRKPKGITNNTGSTDIKVEEKIINKNEKDN